MAVDGDASIWHFCAHKVDAEDDAMRITVNLNEGLVARAAELTGVKEKTALVRLGLETLIALKSGQRLARLAGTERRLRAIPRRQRGS
jgi:Arc/MetJ family transcription regulator